jgi:hypothetical protein
MGFFDQMGGGGSPGAPLASLFSGNPQQLMQLLQAGRMGPQSMAPQFPVGGATPMGTGNAPQLPTMPGSQNNVGPAPNIPSMLPPQNQQGFLPQMLAASGFGGMGAGGNASFLRQLLNMNPGDFSSLFERLGGGFGNGTGGV